MKTFLLACLFCFLPVLLAGQAFTVPEPQSPPKLVNDFSKTLSYTETQWLEDKLVAFDKESSTQICIVLIDSLHNSDIADAATEIGNSWGIGRKGKDNGVLITVAISDRKVNISVGYGLESALSDVTCQEIISNEMGPGFKSGLYYSGLDKATTAIIDATRGQYKSSGSYGGSKGMPRWLIIIILIFGINGVLIGVPILIRWLYEKITGKKVKHRRRNYDYYSYNTSTSEPETKPDSSSGSGSSKDSFEGYGGGRFGGGGASGSW